MTMTDTLEDSAYEMFNAVHDRLGHLDIPTHYFDRPCVKQMWIEVARLVNDNGCRDADAFEMFRVVHHRLADGRDQTSRSEFDAMWHLRRAWLEISDEVRNRARSTNHD